MFNSEEKNPFFVEIDLPEENIIKKNDKQFIVLSGGLNRRYVEIIKDKENQENDKIVLYHVTSESNYLLIMKDSKIKPASETKNRTWRLEIENNTEKENKIYLATEDQIGNLAIMLQKSFGGKFLILKTIVDKNKILPDEDSKADTGMDSLRYLGTCAYPIAIENFELIKTEA